MIYAARLRLADAKQVPLSGVGKISDHIASALFQAIAGAGKLDQKQMIALAEQQQGTTS